VGIDRRQMRGAMHPIEDMRTFAEGPCSGCTNSTIAAGGRARTLKSAGTAFWSSPSWRITPASTNHADFSAPPTGPNAGAHWARPGERSLDSGGGFFLFISDPPGRDFHQVIANTYITMLVGHDSANERVAPWAALVRSAVLLVSKRKHPADVTRGPC